MTTAQRREAILRELQLHTEAITAGALAREFGVSRQVIVQDVAMLRAGGTAVLATPSGYLLPRADAGNSAQRIFCCRHSGLTQMQKELELIVDAGASVQDVTVSHPVYGEIKAMLMLSTREAVAHFLQALKTNGAGPLSSITGGVHLHLVQAKDETVLDRVAQALRAEGLLAEEE